MIERLVIYRKEICCFLGKGAGGKAARRLALERFWPNSFLRALARKIHLSRSDRMESEAG